MDRLDPDQREAVKNVILVASFGLEANILLSASAWPGLGLLNLASKMRYPIQNNIGCIHFVLVSLHHSLQRRG